MVVDLIFSQPGDIAPLSLPALPAGTLSAIPAPVGLVPGTPLLDRVSRLAALSHQDTVAGLLWLAMNFPAVCDTMLDKTECDAVDDEDFPCEESEPFCTVCDAAAGIFTAYGEGWMHFRWDYAPGSKPEVFDAGHEPQIGWRAGHNAVGVGAAGVAQFRAESRLAGMQVAVAAGRLIPAGACVVTNDSAYTVAAGRFYSDVAGPATSG